MVTALGLISLVLATAVLMLVAETALSGGIESARLRAGLLGLPVAFTCLSLVLLASAPSYAAIAAGLLVLLAGAATVYLAMRARAENPVAAPARMARKRRLVAVLVAPALALSAGAVIDWTSSSGAQTSVIPPVGAAVNANTGHVESSPTITDPGGRAYIDGGDIMRVCDLDRESLCTFSAPPRQLRVRPGDVLLFKILLHNDGFQPVPYVKFFVSTDASSTGGPPWPVRIGVNLEMVWPRGGNPEEPERPEIDEIVLKPPRSTGAYLHYVSGSTKLLHADSRYLARLPDGIMLLAGVALTEVGMPKDCFECDRQYDRFISFKARVLA